MTRGACIVDSAEGLLGCRREGARIRSSGGNAIQECYCALVKKLPRFTIVDDKYDALKGASAMLLMTEWREFRSPDFERMRAVMKHSCIFDGRNQFDPRAYAPPDGPYAGVGRTMKVIGYRRGGLYRHARRAAPARPRRPRLSAWTI